MSLIPNTFRRFEYRVYPSNKFWEIWKEESNHTYCVRYGKIDSNGRVITKHFHSKWERDDAYNRIIYQKIGKGYVENKKTKEMAKKLAEEETIALEEKLGALPPIKRKTKAEKEAEEKKELELEENKCRVLRFPRELE